MNAISNSNLLQSLGWAVFNSLWQMALLWVAYQLIVGLFKINKSSSKGFLALPFLFAGFSWFVFTFISFLVKAGSEKIYSDVINFNNDQQLNDWLGTMLPVASVLYLILLLLPLLNFIRNYRYVQIIRRYGVSRANVQWRMFVQKVSAQMGINKPVHVWMSELISSPVTIGYLKPIILLPMAAVNHLTTQQTEAILLHELAHIKRYDYFINLLSKFIQTILYFNPFVKAFVKIIEREREKSCDETVIQFQYEPHGYASALLTLEKASYVPKQSLAVAASDGKKGEFRQRIEWILGIRKKPAFSFSKMAGVLAALLCFIGLNALLIMSKPVKDNNGPNPLAFINAPFILSGNEKSEVAKASLKEQPATGIVNHVNTNSESTEIAKTPEFNNKRNLSEKTEPADKTYNSPFAFVNYIHEIIPELNEHQEKQIQEALAESQRVLNESKWKDMEKSIADALTMVEKEKVKVEYNKAMNLYNTEKIANQLRLAYDKINWDKINAQLDNALAEIKIDSLKNVYTIAISSLNGLQRELETVQENGIPDTDITIESIDVKKKELQEAINKLKTVHPRKIVHL